MADAPSINWLNPKETLSEQARYYSDKILNKGSLKTTLAIDGFTALVQTTQKITRKAEVPTYTLEDGSYAHVHIVLSPLVIDISGLVSDVVLTPSALVEGLTYINDKLGIITKYATPWTQAQQQKIMSYATKGLDALYFVDNICKEGVQLLEQVTSLSEQSTTESFLAKMEELYTSKKPFTITIDGKDEENMFMTSYVVEYAVDYKNGIKYSMTLQKIRNVKDEISIELPDNVYLGDSLNIFGKNFTITNPISFLNL